MSLAKRDYIHCLSSDVHIIMKFLCFHYCYSQKVQFHFVQSRVFFFLEEEASNLAENILGG